MSLTDKKDINITPISSLGEFALIDKLTNSFKTKHKETIKGIGDDCAVFDSLKNYKLLSTDMLVEGVHFDLSYSPLKHLGYKSIAVNVSDICAMNGIATHVTVSIAASNRFSVEALEELYLGIDLACTKYNIDLVGGDTTSSLSGLIISVSVYGSVKKKNISYRSGAKPNDLLVVTGDLGAAYLGLQLLKREKEIFKSNPTMQPDLTGNDYALERQLKPEPPSKYIKILNDLKITPTAMIDISDGLSSEALHIAKASNVGVRIHEEKIPVDYTIMNLANEFNLNPIFCALSGGEDYELLFSINQSDYEKIKKDPDFTIVGYVTDISEGNNFIANDGSIHPLTAQGWDGTKEQ
jgi:thiamine-monophosphate kinase|tara:strand:- start:10417 stop:11472 length:1056 start_codon:yes stop_codon:yes gene_type:complete